MNNILVYDIETVALSDARLDLIEPEHEAPANLKDPAKIAAAIADKKAAWREKAALSPITGRVAMIGCLGAVDEIRFLTFSGTVTDAELDAQEALILQWFWQLAVKAINTGCLLVSFNGHGFDIPFLVKRSWALKVAVPAEIDVLNRWGLQAPWVDLMKAFQAGDRSAPFISLDTVAGFFGLGQKNGDSRELRQLLEHDRERAIAYLAQDLKLTAGIAGRMGIAA